MEAAASLGFVLIVYGVIMFFAIAFSLACYICNALALQTIAKRRGLDKPWAAWIPVGDGWLAGCISDQYRHMTFGEYTGRGEDIKKHGILMFIALAVFMGLYFLFFLASLVSGNGEPAGATASMLVLILFASMIFAMVTAVRYAIRFYKALFDVYRSCMPNMSVPFLLLSLFVEGALSVCLMICRNRDDGMPLGTADVESLE